MPKCDRHLWDDLDKEPCWRCEELRYKKENIMATEACISCGCDTRISVDTHVESRMYYEVGVGQFCQKCYTSSNSLTEDYNAPKKFGANENVNRVVIDAKLIRNTPNDQELGGKIRRLLD